MDDNKVNRAAFIDAVIGNPPFAGKNGIAEFGGPGYLDWLKVIHEGSHGNADYSAHFFRRADVLLGEHGTVGLIATNTIAQGDTRTTGLQAIVRGGHEIYNATRNLPWPGEAAVTVAVVHSAKGRVKPLGRHLDGAAVEAINSRLRPKPERLDPKVLMANASLSFVGSYVLGMGLTLTPEEREALVERDPWSAGPIFPYLGGEEVNTSPTHNHHRYVISFGEMSLEEAGRWPDLLEIVREKVKPERDRNNRDTYRKYWWHFGEKRPALYEAIDPLERCLVTARVTKHLCLSFQPVGRVYAETIFVFALPQMTALTILQARAHEVWARLLSSSMKTDLRYAASDCFETFPFPQPDPRTEVQRRLVGGQERHRQHHEGDRRADRRVQEQHLGHRGLALSPDPLSVVPGAALEKQPRA